MFVLGVRWWAINGDMVAYRFSDSQPFEREVTEGYVTPKVLDTTTEAHVTDFFATSLQQNGAIAAFVINPEEVVLKRVANANWDALHVFIVWLLREINFSEITGVEVVLEPA